MLIKTILLHIFSLNNQKKAEFDFSLIELKDMIEKQISFIENKVNIGSEILNRVEEQLKTTYSVNKEDINYLKDNQKYLRNNTTFDCKLFSLFSLKNNENNLYCFQLYRLKSNLNLLNSKRTDFKNNTISYDSVYKAFFNFLKFFILLIISTPGFDMKINIHSIISFLLSIIVAGYFLRMLSIKESYEFICMEDIIEMKVLYEQLKNNQHLTTDENNHPINFTQHKFLNSDILFTSSHKEKVV